MKTYNGVTISYVRDHIEVRDKFGTFLFSADSYKEALLELEETYLEFGSARISEIGGILI